MKSLITIIFLSLSISNAYALNFKQARKLGVVVEQADGYVKAAKPAGKAIADEVNAKRKKAYAKIAKKNGLSLDAVGKQAAQKIQKKLNK